MAKAALELYSIREMMQKDVFRSLKATKEAGYEGVEFAGFFDMPAEKIKAKLDELDLLVCGSHTGWDLLNNDLDNVFKYNNKIENKNIVLPAIDASLRKNSEDWKRLGHELTKIGRKCKENGFEFAYHNHSFEFEKFDGVSGYQIMFENIDTDYVKLQPDMGWIFFAGEDTDQFIKNYGKYVLNIHVKQFKEAGSHEATEVHKGLFDYVPVIKAYMDLGIEWFIIEQEGFDIPVLESIEENCRELKKMF